jgi:hypothetical protein
MVQQVKKFFVNRNQISYLFIYIYNIHLVYFESLDVNNDRIITRDDLEACLPPTVESQHLIQQLLRQWDMVIYFSKK